MAKLLPIDTRLSFVESECVTFNTEITDITSSIGAIQDSLRDAEGNLTEINGAVVITPGVNVRSCLYLRWDSLTMLSTLWQV